jgi:glycosyltransferase involved in cell wall biosynthesis
MNLVLFTHPEFLASQSMPRFAQGLARAYRERGHSVSLRSARARVRAAVGAAHPTLAKWGGYVDQYLLFPREARQLLKQDPADTLYVFCDQALGPWVPLVAHRPHVVHCHDLLALRSALGEFAQENRTGLTGQLYQRFIRRGFGQARHFISVSERSRADLHAFGRVKPVTSEVVLNGLNYPYAPMAPEAADQVLKAAQLPTAHKGIVLHISGGQWYKNVEGVLLGYARYARDHEEPLPLWLVGVPQQHPAVRAILPSLPRAAQVLFFYGLSNATLQAVYSRARVLLFPSHAEGFGWPIVEAQACGCPVITTADAPMNEVGGPHSVYLPRLKPQDDRQPWAAQAAQAMGELLLAGVDEQAARSAACVQWAARFSADRAIDRNLAIYEKALAWELAQRPQTAALAER